MVSRLLFKALTFMRPKYTVACYDGHTLYLTSMQVQVQHEECHGSMNACTKCSLYCPQTYDKNMCDNYLGFMIL